MAETAGIQTKLEGYKYKAKFSKDSHELRDLLESTLLDCGVRADVVEHVTGHKPKDSYEKQARLYPESLRAEYSKASKKLNIFSNVSHYLQTGDEAERLRKQMREMEERFESRVKLQLKEELAKCGLNEMYHEFKKLKEEGEKERKMITREVAEELAKSKGKTLFRAMYDAIKELPNVEQEDTEDIPTMIKKFLKETD